MFYPWPSGDPGPIEVLPAQTDTPTVALEPINTSNDTVETTGPMDKLRIKCATSELPQHLAKIRAQFNKDSWVLTH